MRAAGAAANGQHRAAPSGSALFVIALLAGSALAGCSATTVAPPADPADPAPVFLLDHGRHTSLVLPTPDGTLVRYAYGDWRYYAERETGLLHAIAALLWRTPGALGRRELPGPPVADEVRLQVPLLIEHLHELQVERAAVEELRARLDALFAAADLQLDSPDTDLVFVRHPRDYTLRHNSNRVIADWLVALGCEIHGWALYAHWKIITPADTDEERQR